MLSLMTARGSARESQLVSPYLLTISIIDLWFVYLLLFTVCLFTVISVLVTHVTRNADYYNKS